MIVVFEEIWPNIRIVTLLHCYIVTFRISHRASPLPPPYGHRGPYDDTIILKQK